MIVARKITGFFGKFRTSIRISLLLFYLIVPWLKWGDRPMILLNIEQRKFFFPGAVFWPQEFYFLLLVVLIAGIALFLFTSLFGRLWCGWACPQTVYTELFDSIGRLVSPRYGKASQRMWEKIVLYITWLALSLFLTFHFMAYFVGARQMLGDIATNGYATLTLFSWPWFFLSITGLVYFDLAYFRHNFCVYLCPYARFQSVMLDEDSIVIAYDKHRGEPRRLKKIKKGAREEEDWGDCTGCRKCVQVCPTGIDIRDGLQVACINCTHCIDACYEEMSSYNKASLVDFSSSSYFEKRQKTKLLRPRTIIYIFLFVFVIAVFSLMLARRIPIYASVTRERSVQPILINDVAQNIYEIAMGNETEKEVVLEISAALDSNSGLNLISSLEILGLKSHVLKPNELKKIRIVLRGNGAKANDEYSRSIKTLFTISNPATGSSVSKKSIFTIPKK